ncbi:hypothetical protein O7621_02225 [Solwaraspora sp. WMMD937]|uniref:hypothetical protein n=1 Tax=unclassified Solwaraspora TaxID=2627926 RepID=UPI00248C27B9|nr:MULTISPECIES: hypothetical protein [unclassified Solwaraspora]WBB97457.1 hypothetical protein O7553_00190 [Solwaraspora sp. WMMA2059]WBC18650.1 hypothetical protein O7543_17140 [Solwaraspora sp. WMMA2080]WFE22210.1 hypothetical protein O7621_02225 [Solwaraspora sp. WMMD937]
MHIDSLAFFIMLISAALSPFLLIYQLTRLAHSQFRNELWLIRDGLVDDLRTGRIQRSPAAERLLKLVKTHISVAGRHTLTDALIALAIFKPANSTPIADQILGDVPPRDRPILAEYLRRLQDASLRHISRASAASWLMAVSFKALRRAARTSGKRERAEKHSMQTIREDLDHVEVQLMPRLMPSRSARKSRRNRSEMPTLVG